MKKVLILAYDFPPYNSIGGQRPYSWLKYLKEFGYEPTVVTRHWNENIQNEVDYILKSQNSKVEKQSLEDGFIWRTPFKPNLRDKIIIKYGLERFSFVRKMLTLFYMLTEFFIPLFDSKYGIYKLANKVLAQEKFDVIIATGEPFILFKYAKNLSKKHKLPWFADYRDGWSTNYNRSKIERVCYNRIERKIVFSASHITTVSKEFAIQLNALLNKEVKVIFNGYFPELHKEEQKSQFTECFKIAYVGTLYSYQNIEMFAESIKELPKEIKDKIRIQFIGMFFYKEQKKRVERAFENSGIFIEFTNRLPQSRAIGLMQEASLLLLPASKKESQIYAKVFDYMAVKRNILLFPSDKGALENILSKTNSGVYADSPKEILDYIKTFYGEWLRLGHCKCKSKDIDLYSRKNQTKELALLFDSKL